jgi:hypothetical protein
MRAIPGATQAFKEGLSVNRLDLSALEVVITAIEHPAQICEYVKVASHAILNQFVCRAAGFCYMRCPYAGCASQSMK